MSVGSTTNSDQTNLFEAIQQGFNRSVVCELISACRDVNATDNERRTALFYAVQQSDNESVVRALIDAKADVNTTDNKGKTALFYAVQQSNNENVVRALIDAGADVNTIDNEGKTAFFYAVLPSKNENVVRALIDAKADVNTIDNEGKTALFYAVQQSNNESVVRTLTDAGADVNITDNEGKTALFYAVDKDAVDVLIQVDEALINARDQYGRTALFYAVKECNTTAWYLIERGGNLYLKDKCNVSLHSFFIENCILGNINALTSYATELFQEQPQLKSLAVAVLDIIYCQAPLLSAKSFPFLKQNIILNNTYLLEALTFARNQGFTNDDDKRKIDKIAFLITEDNIDVPSILALLTTLGANPDAADSDGNTALHYATLLPLYGVSQETVIDICKKLKDLGSMFDVKNQQQQSPLLLCLSVNNLEAIESNNPWHVVRGLVGVCRFLLNNGSSVNETSQSGESAFHLLVKLVHKLFNLQGSKQPEVLQELIDLWKLVASKTLKRGKEKIAKKTDNQLNSPLHLWASLTLPSPQDYRSHLNKDHTFENILQLIFDILVQCGAKLNRRNENDDTPLHLCKTWAAVKLLIDAGAITNDLNSSNHSPLLVAAKNKSFIANPYCFYPDVLNDPKTFWKSALEGGLDPWTADKQGESVLSILIESEAFVLAKALIDVGIELNHIQSETKLALLCIICKDKSTHTHWKTNLVEIILKSAIKSRLPVDSALRLCCRNIVQYSVLDDKAAKNQKHVQRETKEEPNDDDGQPNKKRRKEEEKEESNDDLVTFDSVHWKLAKQLLLYGVDISIRGPSGESCLDIAENCPALKDLLTKPIDIDSVPVLIPWTSLSDRYHDKLAKVARRLECKVEKQIWYHRDHIGSGSFGLIFAGINEMDGREVVIKRIERMRLLRPEDKREIQNLTALADCQQVVHYVSSFQDQDFCYIVLELMEGNLDEYLNESTIDVIEATLLCNDLVMGLKFLHEQDILHRDLKPQNILYKTHPKLCLKIADFGLSRRIDSTSTTVYGTNAGTKCWIAPEILKFPNDHSKSSDMFSCGLLLHYILSGKKHPFCPADCANKNEIQVAHETEDNLMKGKMEGWDNSLSPEASHLVKEMIENTIKNRPTAEEAIDHPLFWTKEKKIDFLEAVGNQPEFECPHLHSSTLNADLQKNFSTIVKYGTWNDPGYLHMPDIYAKMTKRRSYDTRSVVALVRFIRNAYVHISEDTRPSHMRKLLLEDFVFLEHFPDLVMEVYKAVTTHGWDQTRDKIKNVMNMATLMPNRPLPPLRGEEDSSTLDTSTIRITSFPSDTWTAVSMRYKDKLDKVAKRQECEIVHPVWYHEVNIGRGSFALIFAGINVHDGREVAIKRIEKLRFQRPKDKREIQNLIALADCQQVVRYVSFLEDQHFCYVVLELMEGNLKEYLDEFTIDATKATLLCKDVVMGLKFLHELNILHRDLKPQNILYKIHPKLCLKIADFGLSRRIEEGTMTSSLHGTRCWIAPEVLKSSKNHSKSSDMFSCGLLLHYILSGQKHPFSPADCANKGEIQVANETEHNVIKVKMEGWDKFLSPEASHLVRKMIESALENRPTAEQAIDHPLFWTKAKKIDLLIAVGNQPAFEYPRAEKAICLTAVEANLEASFGTIVKYGTWNDSEYEHMPDIYTEMTKRRSYDTRSVVELVRFIRNAYAHISEGTRPSHMRKLLLYDLVFLEHFPDLVMEVYKAVATHGWDQTKDEIKYAMNK